ncbi:A24 family peptidase [Mycobacterium sp. IS-3022]|uniref:prepilin peptidase n=1 Tax=Mycobacterium sp. IS-3022 TaxID=1772277 RepID=UPI002571234B|nr:A24 family peptidase [Mycobacterium sp. IS-3022]
MACAAALAWFAALCVCDLRERRLPNWLTMPGALAVLTTAAMADRGLPALAGAAALFAVYVTVHLLAPEAMGAGDVKLAIGVGALTGAFGIDVWMLAAMGASLITTAWALVVARHPEATVPHGLSMCLAAATAMALVTL